MSDGNSYSRRLTLARISRRRALGGAASLGVGAAALSLVGCGGGGGGGESAKGGGGAENEGTPKPGGIWHQNTITLPTHFSPIHLGADPSFANTWRRLIGYYDGIWATREVTDPARQYYGRLASAWEQPDASSVVVKLRDGVFFHDRAGATNLGAGRQLVAEDVVQSTYEYLKTPSPVSDVFIKSGRDIKSVTAVDKLTVRYDLFGPRAFFYEKMNRNVLPREMLDEKILKETPPIGSGPYMYLKHQQNSSEDAVRNPKYFIKDRPYIEGKSLVFVGDSAAIEAAFRAGQVDDTPEAWLSIKQAESVAADLGKKIKNVTYPSTSGMALLLNLHREPFNDVRVREALYRAVDIDRIIKVVFLGDGNKSWWYSDARPERFPIGRKAVEQYVGYDPKKSVDLLKAAGVDLNKTYGFMVPPENQAWVDGGTLASEDFAKVGFKTRIDPVVRNIYLQKGGIKPGDFDICMTVYLDYSFARKQGGYGWDNASLEDDEVEAVLDKIDAEMDAAKRSELSHQFETIMAKKYNPLMPMLSYNIHVSHYAYMKGINYETSVSGFGGWQIDRWIDKSS